jgi:Mg/Co/Ni transporter MgtE
MPPKSGKAIEPSSAMRELKETVRKQAVEIDTLKFQLKLSGAGPKIGSVVPHGGGHGGGSEVTLDELTSYLNKPFYQIAMARVGWLSLFLVSLSLTALIMNGFEHTLARQIELAYFVPLLAGHGGNTGGQTVGTVLSALSAGTVTTNDAAKVISKEAMSGLMMGIILGAMVGPIAHYGMGISLHVSTVIFCTLPLVSTIAATLGSAIPFLCLALGLEPSVIAAPAMTSFVDVSGLMAYFLIAHEIFSLFGIDL